MKMSPTTLIRNKKITRIWPMGLCDPWASSFINNWRKNQNLDNKTKTTFCWKVLDHSQNNCERLTQWDFVTFGPTLTHTTSNLKNLRNLLEANKCIDDNIWNLKKWHPRHDLPQTCGGRKSVCLVWIRPRVVPAPYENIISVSTN